MAQHLSGIRFVMDHEAESASGIGPDLLIHNSRRFLGSQNQVNAQGAANPGRFLHIGHGFGKPGFHLGEFVHHNKEMAQRISWIKGVKGAHILNGKGMEGGKLLQFLLPSFQLLIQSGLQSFKIALLQIGQGPREMGQSLKLADESAAFEINEQKLDLAGGVV